MSDEKRRVWQCPSTSTMPAAQWVAEQPHPPIEEFRKKTRKVFEWIEPVATTKSRIDPDVARALGELGLRVRYCYRLKSVFNALGKWSSVSPAEDHYEHWLSDDGITSALVPLNYGRAWIEGFETRFAEGILIHGRDAENARVRFGDLQLDREYHALTTPDVISDVRSRYLNEDGLDKPEAIEKGHGWLTHIVADYVSHRARVRERVEAGEVALSIVDPDDREAFSNYYADYMSGKELADAVDMAAALPEVGPKFKVTFEMWAIGAIVLLIALLVGALGFFWGSIGGYIEWLGVWWPIIVVTTIPPTMVRLALLVHEAHLNHLDGKYPDSFDQHAGYWIKERIAAAGLADQIEVGKAKEFALAGLDAYLPLRDKIVLGHKTYDKQDPTFWAIAAHELGHVLDFRARPLMLPLSLGSRHAMSHFLHWANAVLLANMFFGWAFANQVWWFFLVGALVTGAVVLVDEAIASRIGLRILSQDERITAAMMVDLRRHLGFAFGTYAASTMAIIAILLGSDWIAEYIQAHAVFEAAEPLHPGRTTLGNVLSVAVLIAMVAAERTRLARWWRRLRGKSDPIPSEPWTRACPVCKRWFPADVEECPDHPLPLVEKLANKSGCIAILLGVAATSGFFLEVWDQPLGPWYRAAVFAYVPIVMVFLMPALAPVTLLLNLPIMLAKRFLPKPPDETPASRAHEAAADIVAQVQVTDPRQSSPWYLDMNPGLLHYALPLVVLWWASQL